MKTHTLAAGSIEKIGFDPATQQLLVQFRGNPKRYLYSPVMTNEFVEAMTSESLGSYIATRIKGAKDCIIEEDFALLDDDAQSA